MLKVEVGVTQPLTCRVGLDRHCIWVLGCAAQASDAMLRARCESANRSRESAVHARPAGDRFNIPTLLENLPDEQFSKLEAVDLDQESVRPWHDVGRRLGLDMISLVASLRVCRFFHTLLLVEDSPNGCHRTAFTGD